MFSFLNLYYFFRHQGHFSGFFWFLGFSRLEKPPLGFKSSYCITCKCNEMFSRFRNHEFQHFFLQNLQIFEFIVSLLSLLSVYLSLLSFIQVFQPNRKSPLGFDNELLKNVCWPWIIYNFYHKF